VREVGTVVSCGCSGEKGWRAELDLGRGKSLDDHHLSATHLGLFPQFVDVLGSGLSWVRLTFGRNLSRSVFVSKGPSARFFSQLWLPRLRVHQQSFGFRLLPFSPQYPIQALVKSIGQQDQYLQTGSSFPSLNLREVTLDDVKIKYTIPPAESPRIAARENKALLGFVW
jgi:hypothetical protein